MKSSIPDSSASSQKGNSINLPQFELGRAKKQDHSLWRSFGFAWDGIKTVYQNERNFRIHIVIASITLVLSTVLGISPIEWGIILGFIALVLFAELTNSAVEYFVDLLTDGRYHPKARVIKDTMAAAVLVCTICAAITGCIIFAPKVLAIITQL